MTRVLLAFLLLFSALLVALVAPQGQVTAGLAAPLAALASGDASQPDTAPAVALTATSAPLPSCAFDDLPAPSSAYDDWHRTVLDTRYALEAGYVPPDLVLAQSAFGDRLGGGDLLLRSVLIADLTALLSAAVEAGVALAIQSAYRSYDYQTSTFQYWVERNGREAALATSARPGHSEHQLGTALDFRSLDGPPAWELADWAATPEGAWLAANGWRFGFVMSYPRGSEELTCYSYEPWHYRYLGRELAAEVTRLGVTPRELLWAKLAERSE